MLENRSFRRYVAIMVYFKMTFFRFSLPNELAMKSLISDSHRLASYFVDMRTEHGKINSFFFNGVIVKGINYNAVISELTV